MLFRSPVEVPAPTIVEPAIVEIEPAVVEPAPAPVEIAPAAVAQVPVEVVTVPPATARELPTRVPATTVEAAASAETADVSGAVGTGIALAAIAGFAGLLVAGRARSGA